MECGKRKGSNMIHRQDFRGFVLSCSTVSIKDVKTGGGSSYHNFFLCEIQASTKGEKKLIFILQKKATHSYRRPQFPIFTDFVLLSIICIIIHFYLIF